MSKISTTAQFANGRGFVGNGPPFFYDHQNLYDSLVQPSTVYVTNTGLSLFFQRYLLQKAISVFKWELPPKWPRNYMLYCLYMYGYVAVVNTDKFGIIPQQCTLKGYNVFYQPTNVMVTNPLFKKTIEPKIGVQCTLLRLQPDYRGIYDLVSYYGDQMALTAQAFGVNTLNSKLSYLFLCDNEKTGQSFRKLYDNMASGEPSVFADKRLFQKDGKDQNFLFQEFAAQPSKNLMDFLQVMKQLEIMFDCAIGVPNVATARREREITGELEANNQNSRSITSMWLEELQETAEETRKMFHVKLSVDWRYSTPNQRGGESNA